MANTEHYIPYGQMSKVVADCVANSLVKKGSRSLEEVVLMGKPHSTDPNNPALEK